MTLQETTDRTGGRSRRLFGGLLLAHFAAGIALAANFNANRGSVEAMIVNSLFTAIVGSELCLLGFGAAAVADGSTGGKRRLSAAAAMTVWAWLLTVAALCRNKPVPPSFILLLAPAVSLLAIGAGFALQRLGLRLVRQAEAKEAPGDAFQFTLGRMLVAVVGIAAILSAGRALRDSALTEYRPAFWHYVARLFTISSCGVIAGLATWWAVLRPGRYGIRLPLALGVAMAVGAQPAYCFDLPGAAFLVLALNGGLLSLFMAATLIPLRRAGYRLAGREPASAPLDIR